MRNLTLIAIFLVSSITNLFAIPALMTPMTVIQTDGKSLTFVLIGDENSHHRETTDGFWIIQNEAGNWVYAIQNEAGQLSASTYLAHNAENRTSDEIAFLQQININRNNFPQKTKLLMTNAVKQTKAMMRSKQLAPNPTEAKILIVLAEFSDVKFKISAPLTSISAQLNQANYTGNSATGSARDYYIENSDNTFIPQFDVIGPVSLPETMAYYGANDASGYDLRPGTMVTQAAQLAANLTDFSQYDLNQDGKVDKIIVIYAGYNEAEGGPVNSIWPHAWNLTDASVFEGFTIPQIDGVTIDDYACTSELAGYTGTNMAGIGTICHEFGHVLGLPDVYDTDYSLNGQSPAMGSWSLMDSGGYLNNGKTPPYLTAFEREMMGWADITVLENAGIYSLTHVKSGQVYRINSSVTNEYFLLENRQKTGWDTYLPGHGMLITHVDMTNPIYLKNNTLNNFSNHERVDLKEAGGAQKSGLYYISTARDPFPGLSGKTSFDDSTSPANSILWNNTGLNKPIYNIAESNGIISFTFIAQPNINPPLATTATNFTTSSFLARWNSVSNAQNYFIDVYTKTPGVRTTVMDETFSGIGEVSTNNLHSPSYFAEIGLDGWTGNDVFAGCSGSIKSNNKLNALKFGTEDVKTGYVIFPVALDGDSKITIRSKDFETETGGEGAIYTIYHDPNGDSNFEEVSNNCSLDCRVFCSNSFEIPDGTSASRIKLEVTGGRALIERISIESGSVGIVAYVPGYKNLNIGNANAYTVDNLPDPSQNYYYVVRASDGTNTSANSNEITVNLFLGSSGINVANSSQVKIRHNDNTLYIESETGINNIEVFNSVGQLIKKQAGVKGTNTMQLSKNQIYIVKIDGKAVKILM